MVMRRSAKAATALVDVDVLLPGVGSVAPLAGATTAVLSSGPAAVVEARVPDTVMVADAPVGSVTGREIPLPVPDAVEHDAPAPVAAQFHVTPVIAAGTVSVTSAPVAVEGPALDTVMV